MEIYSIITTVTTLIASGGWFIFYRENKQKRHGEAVQAEAEGQKAWQEIYQKAVEDLKEQCEYIIKDRNLLREENTRLIKENNELRARMSGMENTIFDMKREISRLGRKLEALNDDKKKKVSKNKSKTTKKA